MQMIRQGAANSLKFLGLLFFAALALVISDSCAPSPVFAQHGVVPNPEQTIEEILSITGPISMELVWDYVIAAFGPPHTAEDVLLFDSGVQDLGNVFHIQMVDKNGAVLHLDVPLDEMSPGGAISDDGSFAFIWFCYNEETDADPGCHLPLATWVIAYDSNLQISYYWPERINQ